MGAGGRMAVNPSSDSQSSTESQTENQKKRVPSSKPPFTLNDIKKAIPPHCFERSVIKSFYYLVHDLTIAYLLYYIAKTYIHQLPYPLSYLAWPVYWYLQGSFLTAVWIIGHECGHHAFSDYQLLDDTVGLILHSLLLTPYFSWKHSHRRHHANTGSMENDEVYVPKRKTSLKWYYKYLDNPLGRFIILTTTLTLGWPTYLLFNVTGKSYDRYASHFYPYSPFYADRERLDIYISDAGILAVLYGLYRLVAAKGLAYMFSIYGVPLLLVNGFIVLITYLHHTHISLPHYNSSEWDWIRGALATCDRDYGTFLNHVLHNIADTHVLHHLFSSMPHYHAMEATKAMKPLLGEYYQYDGTPVYKAMWREAKQCIYVEPDEGNDQNTGVLWYKNKI